MEVEISAFVAELGLGVIIILPIYLTSYFSSSYFLFNSPHGTISEWNKFSEELSLIVNSELVSASKKGDDDNSLVRKVISEGTRPQILFLSNCAGLILKAEQRLSLYKSRQKFISFGVLLSLSLSLCNALPIVLSGAPLISSILDCSVPVTAIFGAVFIARFNWRQATEWNQFKEAIESNKSFMEKHGFKLINAERT